MKNPFPITFEEKYEALSDQCASIRDIIPEIVAGQETHSMACDPSEVLYFAELYIKELQDKTKVNVFGKMIENLQDENFIKKVVEQMEEE